jgi:hypothetical protein
LCVHDLYDSDELPVDKQDVLIKQAERDPDTYTHKHKWETHEYESVPLNITNLFVHNIWLRESLREVCVHFWTFL